MNFSLKDFERSRLLERWSLIFIFVLLEASYHNVNGYLSDIKALADLAHDHGAYLYVDAIQGVGAVPVDVRAMGIDFAACSTFKWLMGVKVLVSSTCAKISRAPW